MKRKHQPDNHERALLGFWERRKGQTVDDDAMGAYASLYHRHVSAMKVEVMREMVPSKHTKLPD